ncbi:MAG TPA: flagellar biosynthesis protein [Caldimonas sp.]|jgi:flagellar biosynthesis protein FlhG|nr:flagellar biosynthesis protein [Caldimonas sp.]HEX2541109.1 flagellar biosynthesis protein [Caldimonas sp.]
MPSPSRPDQAAGLREMFAHAQVRFVPVVANAHVAFGGVMLERLCTAFAEHGARVLVIDASDRAREAGEMAMVDLGQCIERLSAEVSFLAARKLPLRFVDALGSTRVFLQRAAEASPDSDVVLVHAGAPELCRMFARSRVADALEADATCPILVADDRPESVTDAYAAMKLLATRAGLMVADLLLGAAAQSPRVERIAASVAACADRSFGGVLREWARIDPAGDPQEPPSAALRRLAAARFAARGPGQPAVSNLAAGVAAAWHAT